MRNSILFIISTSFIILGYLSLIPDFKIADLVSYTISILCLVGSVALLFRNIMNNRTGWKRALTDFLIKFVLFIGFVSIGLLFLVKVFLEELNYNPLANYLTQVSMAVLILSYIFDSNTKQ